jgi:two-component system response regulator FixJ
MAVPESLVFIVDDDSAVRDSIQAVLRSAGYAARKFRSAQEFLAEGHATGGCLIADIRMPDMNGLELQEEIVRRKIILPVIIITGHGDVALAVRAMKSGAIDFIEKPFDSEILLTSVQRAFAFGRTARNEAAEVADAERLLALLTPRELKVLDQIVSGRSNKVAAYELGISPRTIEVHRAHIMHKVSARSLSDLVRISVVAGNARSSQS